MRKSQGQNRENWLKKLIFFLDSGNTGKRSSKPGGSETLSGVDFSVLPAAIVRIVRARTQYRTFLAAVPDLAAAEALASSLEAFLRLVGEKREVILLPESSRGKFSMIADESARAAALDRFFRSAPGAVVIGSVHAILSGVPEPARAARTLTLKGGMTLSPEELAGTLVEMDYDDEVETALAGEFSRHGGVIDLFSPGEDRPCRVEFFGDEIDSLRFFDPETQRSTGEIPETYRVIASRPSDAAAREEKKYDFFDCVDTDTSCMLVCEEGEILSALSRPGLPPEKLERWRTERARRAGVGFSANAPVSGGGRKDIPAGVFAPFARLAELAGVGEEWKFGAIDALRRALVDSLKSYLARDYQIVVLANAPENLDGLRRWCENERLLSPGLVFDVGALSGAFVLPEEKLLVIPERELFSARAYERKTPGLEAGRPDGAAGEVPAPGSGEDDELALSSAELAEGDYAVYLGAGIGIFRGLRELESNGVKREVAVMEFADSAVMYISMLQSNQITRYFGSPGKVPLSRAGSGAWQNTQLRAQRAIRSYAADLLRLQAARQASPGIAFPRFELEEKLFAAAFPYPDTPDQARASAEIAADMEKPRPMDRLLCGDVGFGKTEVAMRAAFKAVLSGKQVAVIAPTTVLVQQHYFSFRERFAGHPVNIDFLSRLRSPKEERDILKRLREHRIDIIIGTHKLCSAGVVFADLGLIVIDEEQRFGVKQKEFLRSKRTEVDTLSMSATPIPRTMYMAMAGARDLSTLLTAPQARLPVKTVVSPPDDDAVAEAIGAEVARGGQIYFLHNRIMDIERRAAQLRALLPDVRFAVAHGQMEEGELSVVMTNFIEGKIDCLVSTTIVESGLDVPNANTIIIENADRFGLAELYQLRGRVGRWKHQAYAYLLLPRSLSITADARKRLSAIRRCSQLGSGMQLAIRDLEIRGAGNLLGAEQSGHLNAIGFELYCHLLKMEVAALRGKKIAFRPEVSLGLDFVVFASSCKDPSRLPAAIPGQYIGDERVRFDLYRRLTAAESREKLQDLRNETADRFGKLPEAAENFFKVLDIRSAAARAGYSSLSVTSDGTVYLKNGVRTYRKNGMLPRISPRNPPGLKLAHLKKIVDEAEAEHRAATGQNPPANGISI